MPLHDPTLDFRTFGLYLCIAPFFVNLCCSRFLAARQLVSIKRDSRDATYEPFAACDPVLFRSSR